MSNVEIVAVLKDGREAVTGEMDEATAKDNLARITGDLNDTSPNFRFVKLSDTVTVDRNEVNSVSIRKPFIGIA
jgi:hypothetical protein